LSRAHPPDSALRKLRSKDSPSSVWSTVAWFGEADRPSFAQDFILSLQPVVERPAVARAAFCIELVGADANFVFQNHLDRSGGRE